MREEVYVVRLGSSDRLERLLRYALEGREVTSLPLEALTKGVYDARILFAVAVDALGVDEEFLRALRILRGSGDCLRGSLPHSRRQQPLQTRSSLPSPLRKP